MQKAQSLSDGNTYITDQNNKTVFRNFYTITTENKRDTSHNINISHPTFCCFAFSEAEAIGMMATSDFHGKKYPICSIEKS